MSEAKLSSDEVPKKFSDWLLTMGCPPDKVPPVDKISQMCRGTYYLVWRSLMEQVESKDTIKQKRLQVFADDVRRCKKKNLFTERDTNVLIPPELTLWRQQADVLMKVAETEARVAEARRDLNDVMDKVSSKMSQRNLSRQAVQDLQRRSWLLQLVMEELQAKKTSLAEARTIAEEMCSIREHTDVQPKLDRCLSAMRRQPAAPAAPAVASSMLGHPGATVGNHGDVDEEHITQLAQCRGDVLWSELYARRAALVAALTQTDTLTDVNRPSFQSVLTRTAAAQCALALDALKCREMSRLAQARLADAVNHLNLSSESCELLVLRCERARTQARVDALKSLLGDVTARSGAFHALADREDRQGTRAQIDRVDKAIENKKDEIKSVVSSLAATDRKIQNVRECLVSIFNAFQKDSPVADVSCGRGIQLDLPIDTIGSLRQFYEQRREKRRNKMELSLEFDVSEGSINEDVNNARFVDELRVYLKKFNLEKNRKLVLESGEKIWIFETLQASIRRIYGRWQAEDVTCPLLCPSLATHSNVLRALGAGALRDRLRAARTGGEGVALVIDINKHTNEEDRIIDKVKKRLDDNLRSLQKTSKTLDQGKENLTLWSNNKIQSYISHQRTVDGKPYKAYEAYYLESLNF